MRLTTVTIAKNEQSNIARALRSVQNLADESLVVDAESTDRTREIAQPLATQVFVRPWLGYGPQKNFGLEQAQGDWALFLDADEEVPPALADEIHSMLGAKSSPADPEPSVYFLRIVTVFLGRKLRRLWGTNPRLLRRGAVTWENRLVHEQVRRADGTIVRLGDPDTALLKSPLVHHSHYDTLAAYRERRARYTTRDAEEMLQSGADRLGKPLGDPLASPLATFRFLTERAFKQFARLFFRKRGFLDGWQGWLWCWLSAEYEYIMCKKYLTLRHERDRVDGRLF